MSVFRVTTSRVVPPLLPLAVLVVALLASSLAAAPALAGPAPAPPAAPAAQAPPVDINTAGVDELGTLPGIGPALAQRIVEHRREKGPFQKVDDLLAVKGIGPKMLAKIRDRLTVGAPRTAK